MGKSLKQDAALNIETFYGGLSRTGVTASHEESYSNAAS
jgi:hypothetical protein